jgi:PAS domain S-box-containing protein
VAEVPVKMALPAPRAEHMSLLIARTAAFFVAVIGGLILFVWQLPIPQLTQSFPGLASMTPAAAGGIVAGAIGLFCLTFRAIRPLARLIGFALVVLGLAILSQDLLGFNLGLDQALVRGDSIAASAAQSGEMHIAPGVTGLLILLGLALLYAKQGGISSAFAQILALIILSQVLIVLAGYAYGVATYYYPFPFTDMSMYGALCGFLLGIGLLAASPDYGIAAAIVEQSPAGEMLRRLLPGIIVLPLVIGWFAHQAEAHTLYDSAATLAIFAVASILVLALFAWTTIGAVRRADRDRNAALMELRGQREWLSTTLASIGDGVIATDPNGSVLLLNKIAEEMTGWPGQKARGRPIWEVFRVINESTRKPVDDPALKALRERTVTRFESGALLVTRDKREIPVEHCGAPIVGFDGSLAGAVLIFRDVTERRRTAQRQSMLVGELNHRVKNALAIVQSLVQASLRQATSRPAQAMAQTLAERLQALHRAHDLLLESQWSGASLKAMVERELYPYRREGGPKIMIKGPDVLLPPACTSIIAMTLHELATNAVKYGALSSNSGQLGVSWRTVRGGRLHLTWEERATLQNVPTRRGGGFGMQLIDKGVRHNLGGNTKVEFRPTGLHVELNVPLEPSKEPRNNPQKAAAAV